jgi:hypothetical protein
MSRTARDVEPIEIELMRGGDVVSTLTGAFGQSLQETRLTAMGDVPLFVEHCEAVAAKVDVKRRWHGEQGRHVSF